MQHGQPQMIKIIITTFKHNTDRKPFEILIEREDTLPYCPVQALVEYCLISNREGLRTSVQIMGLSTIDPHSHKEQTKFYKIPKIGVNRPNSKNDTAIWKCQNLQRNVCHPDAVRQNVRMAMHFFVNLEVFK